MSQKILRTMQDDLKEVKDKKSGKGLFKQKEPQKKDGSVPQAQTQAQPVKATAPATAPKTNIPAQNVSARPEKFRNIQEDLKKKGFLVSVSPIQDGKKKEDKGKDFFAKLQEKIARKKKELKGDGPEIKKSQSPAATVSPIAGTKPVLPEGKEMIGKAPQMPIQSALKQPAPKSKEEELKEDILEEVHKEQKDILSQIKNQEENRKQELKKAQEEIKRQEDLMTEEAKKAALAIQKQEQKLADALREVSDSLNENELKAEESKRIILEETQTRMIEEEKRNKEEILAQIRKQEEIRHQEMKKAQEELKRQEALHEQEIRMTQKALQAENAKRAQEAAKLQEAIKAQEEDIAELVKKTADIPSEEDLVEAMRIKILEEEKKNKEDILIQMKNQEAQLASFIKQVSETLRQNADNKETIEKEILSKLAAEEKKRSENMLSQIRQKETEEEKRIALLQATIQDKDKQISNLLKGISDSLQDESESSESKQKLIEEMKTKIAELEDEKKRQELLLKETEDEKNNKKIAEERKAAEEEARRIEEERKAAEEAAQKAAEEERLRQEEARRIEEEQKAAEEEARRIEEERQRLQAELEKAQAEEAERKRQEEEARRIEEERKAAEEAAQKAAEEERLRQEEARRIEEEQKAAEEEARRIEEERQRLQAELEKAQAEEAERKRQEEEARRIEEERKAAEEAAQKAAEEERLRQEEEKRKAAEESLKQISTAPLAPNVQSKASAQPASDIKPANANDAFWNAIRKSGNPNSVAVTPAPAAAVTTSAPSAPATRPGVDDAEISNLIKRVSDSMESPAKTSPQTADTAEVKPDKDKELKDLLSRMSKNIAQQKQEVAEEKSGISYEEYMKKTAPANEAAGSAEKPSDSYWSKIHDTLKEPAISPEQRLMGGSNIGASPYDQMADGEVDQSTGLAMPEAIKTAQQRLQERRISQASRTNPENRLIQGRQEFYSTVHKTIKPKTRTESLEGLDSMLKEEEIHLSETEEKQRLRENIISKYGIKLSQFPWFKVILVSTIFLAIVGGTMILIVPRLKNPAQETKTVTVGKGIAEIDQLIYSEATAKKNQVTSMNYFDANLAPWKSFDDGAIIRLNVNYDNEDLMLSRDEALKAILGETNFANMPDNFLSAISTEYDILVFKESGSVRLGLIFKYNSAKQEEFKDIMTNWEQTSTRSKKIYVIMKSLFVNARVIEQDSTAFQPATYNETELRFVNLPDSETSMDYFLYDGYVVFTSSKDHTFQMIDLLKK